MLKINKEITFDYKSKIILIMTISFMLFSVGMYFVYADANSDVINQRNLLDKLETDIRNQEDLVEALEDEEDYWEKRVTDAEDYLDQMEETEKISKDNYDAKSSIKPETQADIDEIERLKDIWETDKTNTEKAQDSLDIARKDLNIWQEKLLDARNKLRDYENKLPDEEEKLDEYRVIANQLPKNYQKKNVMISIILSKTCMISENCPTYEELATMYDNSNRYISGDFIQVDSGYKKPIYDIFTCEGNCNVKESKVKVGEEPVLIWKRDKPLLGEHTVQWYLQSTIPVLTFVDPDDETRQKSKEIIIEPYLPQFDLSLEKKNNTLSYSQDRHIQNCAKATIGWKPYGDELLADTWNYFYNNCSSDLDFETDYSYYTPPTLFTDCHSYCEYLKWVEKAKIIAREYSIGK